MSDRAIEVIVFAMLLVFREWRNRRWLKQDLQAREEAAKVREAHLLTSIAANTEITEKAARRADESASVAHTAVEKIDQNTKISQDAFRAANGVNEKFLAVHTKIELAWQEQKKEAEALRKKQKGLEDQFLKMLADIDAMLPEKQEREG